MQTGTFYIASSIKNIKRVQQYATTLEEFGLRWCNNYAWASHEQVIEDEGILALAGQENTLVAMAARDIAGAVGATIFVGVMCPEFTQRGSFVELGARLGHYREAHIILNGYKDMFFFHHPNVVVHQTWSDFVLAMFPDLGYIPPIATQEEVAMPELAS